MEGRPKTISDRQWQRIDKAAWNFVEALLEAQGTTTDFISARSISTELIENFFDAVIDDLRSRIQDNRAALREPDEQQRQQLVAAQSLGRESADSYTGFLDSLFFYWRNVEEAEKATER